MQYTLQQIATISKGILFGKNLSVNRIAYDSRIPFEPDGTIFIALKTNSSNGHLFIENAKNKGCKAFIISDKSVIDEKGSYLLVDDTLTALQKLAAFHRSKINYPIVGITGSTGKTTVKEWLHEILLNEKKVSKSPKSFNSQLGVAISVLQLNNDNEIGILEAGISESNEMFSLSEMIKPTIGLITNIGDAHQAHFSSYEAKLLEKIKLFEYAKTIIFCADQQLVSRVIKRELPKKNLFSWGRSNDSELKIMSDQNGRIKCRFEDKEFEFELNSNNQYHFENVMHCVALCLVLNISVDVILSGIKKIKPLPMRLEMKHGQFGTLLINDSYSADFQSLEVALEYLFQIAGQQSKTLIVSEFDDQVITSAIYQERFTKYCKQYEISKLILIGDSLKLLAINNVNHNWYASAESFIKHNEVSLFANEAILIKGARKYRLEQLINLFQAKSHRTRLEINLSALRHNFNYIKQQIGKNTQIMVMLKAVGYGAGTFELARLLQIMKANYIAVAYIDEGVELRQKGISLPIMVLSPEGEGFVNLISHQLEPEIYSFSILNELLSFLQSQVIAKPLLVHINIDTGMRRLGFSLDEIFELIEVLKQNDKLIQVQSIFTHLAAADEEKHDNFTKQQLRSFELARLQIVESLPYNILSHVANTAGALRHKNSQFDMIRLGIGFYGIDPSGRKQELQLAFRWVSQINQIKKVLKGESVGYSRNWFAKVDSIIATIPVGYADGLSRLQGNEKGAVYINGKRAPIVGAVCMDMCMVDVSKIDCKVGDDVVLFETPNQLNALCQNQNTIAYELFSQISGRVKRIYLEE